MTKALSNKIYLVRFFMAVLVVSLHCNYFQEMSSDIPFYGVSFAIQNAFYVVAQCAVPVFFVLSAYLLFYKYEIKNYFKMIITKGVGLVITYLLWNVIGFVFARLINPALMHEPITITATSLVNDILLAYANAPLWFIGPLVVYMVASPIFYFVFKYFGKRSIVLFVFFVALNIGLKSDYKMPLYWLPIYFVGSYLAYFKISFDLSKYKKIYVPVAFVLFALVSWFLYYHDTFEATYIYRLVVTCLTWLVFDVIKYDKLSDKTIPLFKTSSFIFYAHVTLILLTATVAYYINPVYTGLTYLLLFFIRTIVIVGILSLIGILLQKYTPRAFAFITTGRIPKKKK